MGDEISKILNNMMENTIDEFMYEHNFKRRKNSLIYSRKIETTKQKVKVVFFRHPSYHPGAIAHIYPWLYVCYPELNQIAYEIFKEVNVEMATVENAIRQPIQIYANAKRWMLMEDEKGTCLQDNIKEFLKTHTIPLLDSLKSIEGFIELYEKKDKRVLMDDTFYVFIISAYVFRGEYRQAQDVLEKRFGKPGLRKRYTTAFEYLEDLMAGAY